MSLTFSDKKEDNIIAYVTTKDKNKVISNLILSETENHANDVGLDDNHKFTIAPRPIKEKERSVLFVAGESGAGKSYFIKQYAMNYKKMFPDNPIFLISYLDRDETLDSYKEIKRIDSFTKEFLCECETIDINNEFGDSFVIFDDIDSISNKKEKVIIYGLYI
jgi:chromosomal replication initiation ATPase DnaA